MYNMSNHPALARASAFCEAFNIRVPILMAPMGSVSPASLAIAIANAGGLGGCGAVGMQPDAIRAWASDVRAGSNGAFQLNLWVPDPTPKRDMIAEDTVQRQGHGDESAAGKGVLRDGDRGTLRQRAASASHAAMAGQCPLCSESDQKGASQRMTLCAKTRLMHRNKNRDM